MTKKVLPDDVRHTLACSLYIGLTFSIRRGMQSCSRCFQHNLVLPLFGRGLEPPGCASTCPGIHRSTARTFDVPFGCLHTPIFFCLLRCPVSGSCSSIVSSCSSQATFSSASSPWSSTAAVPYSSQSGICADCRPAKVYLSLSLSLLCSVWRRYENLAILFHWMLGPELVSFMGFGFSPPCIWRH